LSGNLRAIKMKVAARALFARNGALLQAKMPPNHLGRNRGRRGRCR
jgi:hypothetical protein